MESRKVSAASKLMEQAEFWHRLLPTLSEIAGQSGLSIASLAITMGIEQLIIIPFLVRVLDESLFGSFVLVRNGSLLIANLVCVGISTVILREHAKHEGAEKSILLITGLVFNLALMGLFSVVLWGSSATLGDIFGDPSIAHLVPPFALFGLIYSTAVVLQTHYRVHMRLSIFYALKTSLGLGYLLVIPFFYLLSVNGIAWGYMGSVSIGLLVTLYLVRHLLANRPLFRREYASIVARDMLPLSLGVLMLTLMRSADKYIIGLYLDTSAVTYYFTSTSVAYMLLIPLEGISQALLPRIATRSSIADYRRQDLVRLLIVAVGGAQLAVLAGGAILGPYVTNLLYGAGTFEAGKTLYYILLTGVTFAAAYIILRNFITIYFSPLANMWAITGPLILNLVLSLGLGRSFGVTGIAIGTALALIFRGVLFMVLTARLLGRSPRPPRGPQWHSVNPRGLEEG